MFFWYFQAITLMQQIVIQYTSQSYLVDEISSIKCVLSRMTQMSLYLDVYSDYVKFLFCEGLIDTDHCELAINSIRQTMDQSILLINASFELQQRILLTFWVVYKNKLVQASVLLVLPDVKI